MLGKCRVVLAVMLLIVWIIVTASGCLVGWIGVMVMVRLFLALWMIRKMWCLFIVLCLICLSCFSCPEASD